MKINYVLIFMLSLSALYADGKKVMLQSKVKYLELCKHENERKVLVKKWKLGLSLKEQLDLCRHLMDISSHSAKGENLTYKNTIIEIMKDDSNSEDIQDITRKSKKWNHIYEHFMRKRRIEFDGLDFNQKLKIAESNETDDFNFIALSKDKNVEIKKKLLENEKLPIQALGLLMKDSDKQIKEMALKRLEKAKTIRPNLSK